MVFCEKTPLSKAPVIVPLPVTKEEGMLSLTSLVNVIPDATCSLSFGDSDGRLQVASFDIELSGYNDAMRSYRITVGIKKANIHTLDSYSGAVLFAKGNSFYRSEDITFTWNESTSLYETTISFDDFQYSKVRILLQTAPDIAGTSLWMFGKNTASAVAFVEESESTYKTSPFATKDKPANLRLLAYRFRAYESVYNAYYRDIRNNPFVVNGRPVYNKWLSTMKGGADTTLYEPHIVTGNVIS